MFSRFHTREARKLFFYFLLILFLSLAVLFTAVLFRYLLEINLLTRQGSFRPSLKSWMLYLFLWEGMLAVSVSYVFYRLFISYERCRLEQEEFLRLLLAALSHRFGNFLSAQKVNLEILTESPSPEAASRLKEACRAMERDLETLLRFLRGSLEEPFAPTNDFAGHLKDLLHRLELQFGPRRVHLSLGTPLPPLSPELELLLFLILENAFRHSREDIWIRTGCWKNRFYLLLMNDLSPHPVKGAGLGLYLARRLAERLGLEISISQKPDRFAIRVSRPTSHAFSTKFPRRKGPSGPSFILERKSRASQI